MLFLFAYKSKYTTCVAEIAPQRLKKLATETTAVVVPDHVTIVPMHKDNINCAKKTMLLTMAISVPSPLICAPCDFAFASTANYT